MMGGLVSKSQRPRQGQPSSRDEIPLLDFDLIFKGHPPDAITSPMLSILKSQTDRERLRLILCQSRWLSGMFIIV